MRTRVKICGITREQDLEAAAGAGADAIGLVFYPPSPRFLSLARARELRRAAPPFVTTVALFVNAPEADVRRVLDEVRPARKPRLIADPSACPTSRLAGSGKGLIC